MMAVVLAPVHPARWQVAGERAGGRGGAMRQGAAGTCQIVAWMEPPGSIVTSAHDGGPEPMVPATLTV